MHDPRIGRFFAVDPLAPEYPHNSPYAFSENMVIHMIELEGLEAVAPLPPALPPMTVVPPATAAPPAGSGPLILVAVNIQIWDQVYKRVTEYNKYSNEIEESEKRMAEREPMYAAAEDAFDSNLMKYGPEAGLSTKEVTELMDLNSRSLELNEYERGRYFNLKKKVREGTIANDKAHKKMDGANHINVVPDGALGNHVFGTNNLRPGSGKFANTPESREFISTIASEKNWIGNDKFGKQWYSYVSENGSQIYAYTQGGNVKGAGYNRKGHHRDIVGEEGLVKE